MNLAVPPARAIAVLRPEPGNAQTAARLEALGLTVERLPLFHVVALDWTPPAADRFDALLLTSANTLRHGGGELDTFRHLPVVAVGAATAAAARGAGFDVVHVGADDAATAARASGYDRLLHLGGRDRTLPPGLALAIPVYASAAIAAPNLAAIDGQVAMLHSTRAARVLASIGVTRATIRIAAISRAVADAAGTSWQRVEVASNPTDAALVDIAERLAIDP